MRSGVSEGRSGPCVIKVSLFVTVFAGISDSLFQLVSLALGTIVIYTIYYIIVKYTQQKVVTRSRRRTDLGWARRGATASTARWPGRSTWWASGGRCFWCASS